MGRFLEFRVVRNPAQPDRSQVPLELIPNPSTSGSVARTRTFEFGRGANQTVIDRNEADVETATAEGPGGIKTNGGGGWDHPIHIHFEVGLILSRKGSRSQVQPWEQGQKDVYRLQPGGEMQISLLFRDWGGMYMQHSHTTTHEDKAMLMRWDLTGGGAPSLVPMPTPLPRPQGVQFAAVSETLP